MKKTFLLLVIFTAMMCTVVCPSHARETAQDSIIALLNDIKAQILAVQTQISSSQTQISSIEAQITSIQAEISSIEAQIASGQTQVGALSTTVNDLSAKVDALSDKFDIGVTVTQKIFYLTKDPVSASEAKEACDNGFHMASLWEILDPTTLQYDANTTRAYHRSDSDDQGSGPPSEEFGWVRTGKESTASDNTSGNANCANWSSTDHANYGSVIALLNVWDYLHFSAPWWLSVTAYCDASDVRVWCIQD